MQIHSKLKPKIQVLKQILKKGRQYVNKTIPKIQTGVLAGNASTEHIVILKMWRKTLKTQVETRIFQEFDM